MILSVSRRTDIPAFYSVWFLNRLQKGELLVPHVRRPGVYTKLLLSPDLIDCIVFWTKNPFPMLDRLSEIDAMGYPYYFSFTVTPYGRETEPGLPPKQQLIDCFCRLSDRIGPERVDWRCDPILLTAQYPLAYHLEQFESLCRALSPYTTRCILSFADPYPHLNPPLPALSETALQQAAAALSNVAQIYRLPLFACAEEHDFSSYGIRRAACIDKRKIETMVGSGIQAGKDAGQRPGCGCIESVDVGVYDTCPYSCVYCYATANRTLAAHRYSTHDPDASSLTGEPEPGSTILQRSQRTLKNGQLSLFD